MQRVIKFCSVDLAGEVGVGERRMNEFVHPGLFYNWINFTVHLCHDILGSHREMDRFP